jgi:hypothetical protein
VQVPLPEPALLQSWEPEQPLGPVQVMLVPCVHALLEVLHPAAPSIISNAIEPLSKVMRVTPCT